jgi:hypothetical protein
MSTLTYEAFLPHHTASKHRVMAITRAIGQHTQLEAIATVGDALTARWLADALNSRLLDRPNHSERLDAALAGLPDSVRAAVTQLPIDPKHAHIGRTAIAAHIYTSPVDGLLLFPTTACTPGQCPNCTDCANDCRDCTTCTDRPCENCVPPDLTPRTAYALTVAGAVLADRCYDAVTGRSTRMTPAERREFLPLPKALHGQDDEFIRRMARCFDDLTADLDNGEPPQLHNLAEQLALHLMIDDADARHTDDLDTPDELLPTSDYDYDFAPLYDVLFEDDDHVGLLEQQRTEPRGQLDYLFDPFYNNEARDPDRGFRR